MRGALAKRIWTSKPRVGVQIDRTHPLARGLVACWPLNEAAGQDAHDLVGGRDLTTWSVNGGAPFWSVTSQGWGVFFQGNTTNAEDLHRAVADTLTAPFTLIFWARPDSVTAPAIMTPFSSRSPSDNSFDIKFNGGTSISFDIGTGSAWIATAVSTSYSYSAQTWQRIAFVATPTTYALYAQGFLIGSGALSGTGLLWDPTHDVIIGNNLVAGTSETFFGPIADVRAYNRALSAAEVALDYANPWALFAPRRTFVPTASTSAPGAVGAALTAPAGRGHSKRGYRGKRRGGFVARAHARVHLVV